MIIGASEHGRVIICPKQEHKLALIFNNIIHALTPCDFQEFRHTVALLLHQHKNKGIDSGERTLNIKTQHKGMFFSFNSTEITELNSLLDEAYFKWQLYDRAYKTLN
jgi:hypothetical protein